MQLNDYLRGISECSNIILSFFRIDHVYTVKEREVFRLLLENIVRNENYGTLSSTEALNCIPNMRAGDVQDVIDKLVSDQWFVETVSIFIKKKFD